MLSRASSFIGDVSVVINSFNTQSVVIGYYRYRNYAWMKYYLTVKYYLNVDFTFRAAASKI